MYISFSEFIHAARYSGLSPAQIRLFSSTAEKAGRRVAELRDGTSRDRKGTAAAVLTLRRLSLSLPDGARECAREIYGSIEQALQFEMSRTVAEPSRRCDVRRRDRLAVIELKHSWASATV